MEQANQADVLVEAVLRSLKSQLKDVLKEEIAQSGLIKDLIRSELASSISTSTSQQHPSNNSTSETAPLSRPSTPVTNPHPTATGQQSQQPQTQQDSLEAAMALVGMKTEDSPQQNVTATVHTGWPTMYAKPRNSNGRLPTPNTTPMPPPRSSRRHGEETLRDDTSGKRSRSPEEEEGTRSDWVPITALGLNGNVDEAKRRRTGDVDGEPVTPTSADGDEYSHYSHPRARLPPYQLPTTRQAHKNESFNQLQSVQHPHPHILPGGRFHFHHRYTDEDHDDDYEEGTFAPEEDHETCRCREYLEMVIACRDTHCPIQYLRTSDPNLSKKPNATITPSRSRATTPTSPSLAASAKKSSPRPPVWKCDQCGTTTTSQRRPGPKGRSTLCNACWTRGRKKSKVAAQQAAQEKAQQVASATESVSGNASDGETKVVKAEKSSSSSSTAAIAPPDKNSKDHGTRAAAKANAAALASAIAASTGEDRVIIPILPTLTSSSTDNTTSVEPAAPSTPPPSTQSTSSVNTPTPSDSILNGCLVATPPPRQNCANVATSPHISLNDSLGNIATPDIGKGANATGPSVPPTTIAPGVKSLPFSSLETSMDLSL